MHTSPATVMSASSISTTEILLWKTSGSKIEVKNPRLAKLTTPIDTLLALMEA